MRGYQDVENPDFPLQNKHPGGPRPFSDRHRMDMARLLLK